MGATLDRSAAIGQRAITISVVTARGRPCAAGRCAARMGEAARAAVDHLADEPHWSDGRAGQFPYEAEQAHVLNELTVHSRLLGAAAQLLSTQPSDLRIYNAHIMLKSKDPNRGNGALVLPYQ